MKPFNTILVAVSAVGIKHRSRSKFSSQYQYIVKHTGDKNNENHQLGDIVLMYHQILRTNIKRNVGNSQGEF
jgi:hypothetical protein